MYTDNDFRLYHHGIRGQKWGNKNGPPYPLSPSDHSSSEQKAGWRQSLSKGASAVSSAVKKTVNTSVKAGKAIKGTIDEQKKQKLLKSGDEKAITNAARKGKVTLEEYEKAIKIISLETKLKEAKPSAFDDLDKVSKDIKSISGFLKEGTSLYNQFVDIMRTTNPDYKMVKIGESKKELLAAEKEKQRAEAVERALKSGDDKLIAEMIPVMTNKEVAQARVRYEDRSKLFEAAGKQTEAETRAKEAEERAERSKERAMKYYLRRKG